MTLRPYAARPGRLAVQVAADVAVVLWGYVWYRVARAFHDLVQATAGLGYSVESRAVGVERDLREASDGAGRVPLVGDALGAPLRAAGGKLGELAATGREAGDSVAALALPAALAVAAGPVLSVVLVWLFLRLRFALRAGASAELATREAGEDLLALRALTGRPLRRLTAIHPDPVEAWRRGDPQVVAALAALELHADGVRARRPRASLTR